VAKYLGNLTAQTQLARDRGQYAYQAGQDIANNGYNTTSALAQLANQQGSGLSDLYGSGTGNIANLLAGAGGAQADSYSNLATLLTNIANGTQGNFVAASQIPGVQNRDGMLSGIGQAAEGVGLGMSGYAAMMASDIRLKTNIQRIGRTPAGYGVYTWD